MTTKITRYIATWYTLAQVREAELRAIANGDDPSLVEDYLGCDIEQTKFFDSADDAWRFVWDKQHGEVVQRTYPDGIASAMLREHKDKGLSRPDRKPRARKKAA